MAQAAIGRGKKHGTTAPSSVRGLWSTEDETFSGTLRRFIQMRGLSVTRLAHRSWLDTAYVWRLAKENVDILNKRSGRRRDRHPSRDAVIRLGLGLGLVIEEMDELLLAAGYAPLVR